MRVVKVRPQKISGQGTQIMLLGLRSLTEEKTVTEASKESCKGINIGRINFDTVVPERGLRTNMQIDKSSALTELLF